MNFKTYNGLKVRKSGLFTREIGDALAKALRSLRLLSVTGIGCTVSTRNEGDGEMVVVTVPGGGGRGGCCGLSDVVYSVELNTAFIKPVGGADYLEMDENDLAGMIIVEGENGVWVATFGSYEWTGNGKGTVGVTFEVSGGTPDVESFTLQPMPGSVVVQVAGTTYTATLVKTQGDIVYAADDGTSGDLVFNFSAGDDGTWELDTALYTKEGGVGFMLGEYEDGSGNVAWVGTSDAMNTGAGTGGAGGAGGVSKPAGPDGAVQVNFGGALMGSGGFKVVEL